MRLPRECRKLSVVLMVWTFIVSGSLALAQTPLAAITIPINGQLAVVGNLRGTVMGRGSNQLLLVNTSDGNVQVLSQNDIGIRSPVWSADGSSLAFARIPTISRYDQASQVVTDLLTVPDQIPDVQDWSPDGEQLLTIIYENILNM